MHRVLPAARQPKSQDWASGPLLPRCARTGQKPPGGRRGDKTLPFLDDPRLDEVGDLRSHPRAQSEGERVGDSELRHVSAPERCEMNVEANLSAAVHLGRLAV